MEGNILRYARKIDHRFNPADRHGPERLRINAVSVYGADDNVDNQSSTVAFLRPGENDEGAVLAATYANPAAAKRDQLRVCHAVIVPEVTCAVKLAGSTEYVRVLDRTPVDW